MSGQHLDLYGDLLETMEDFASSPPACAQASMSTHHQVLQEGGLGVPRLSSATPLFISTTACESEQEDNQRRLRGTLRGCTRAE
jgi:hypothetical protein